MTDFASTSSDGYAVDGPRSSSGAACTRVRLRPTRLVSGGRVHEVPFAGGVFGGVVPPGFERPDDVRYLR